MIKEEYAFTHIQDYLYNNIDLLIAGTPNQEERSQFFSKEWDLKGKDILYLDLNKNELVKFKLVKNKTVVLYTFCTEICLYKKDDPKAILID